MNQKFTREEVIEAGKEIVMGSSGIEPFGFVFISLGIILLAEVLYQLFKKSPKDKTMTFKIALGMVLLIMPFWLIQGPTTEEKITYKKEKEEWKKEYAEPYINDSLEIVVKSPLVDIQYDRELGENGKRYYAVAPGEGRVMPIRVETAKGEIISIWVDTIIEEDGENRLVYQELDELLNAGIEESGDYLTPEPIYGKNYPAGIYNAKLYIDKKTYERLIKIPDELIKKK